MFYYYYAKADIILIDISKNSSISNKLYSSIIIIINGYIEDRQEINSRDNYKPSKVVSLFFFDFSLRSENDNL